MKKIYKALKGYQKTKGPKNVMVLANIWTSNQNAEAPTSSGTVTAAVTTTNQVLNAESGVVTITGLTAASGANQVTTIQNNKIIATSNVRATLNGYTGTWATNGEPCLIQVSFVAGSMTFRILNCHDANALAGNVTISFQVGQVVR